MKIKTPTYKLESANMFDWQMTEVLDNMNIGFFSKDITTNKYIRLSEGCPLIYGYSFEDFYSNGDLWYDVIVDEDKHIPEKQMLELKSGSKSISEYRILHPNGKVRWIKLKALPVFSGRQLTGVEGIVYDITESKHAELQTIKAKEFSESIINSLPGIFYLIDEDGRYLNWNRNFENATGFTGAEIAARNVGHFVFEDDLSLIKNTMKRVFETGSGEVEARLIRKDGSIGMYYFNGQRVIIEGKSCLAGMGIDISKRKAAEERLQKNEEMLSHILNSIPQSILWKDTNSNIIGGNAVFASKAGIDDMTTIIGKNDFALSVLPENVKKYQQDDLEVMKSKQPRLHFIETLDTPDGETKWLDTTKIPLKDVNDNVYGILVVIDDITEKKLKEDEQHKVNEELIRKNIELREFSYIVSHNLRAPIAKILGLAALFDKENIDIGLNKEIIGHVTNEVSGLDTIVRDLNIILAHQSAGDKLLETVVLDDMLNECKQHFEREISESGALIMYDFAVAKSVNTVKSYLSSILNNLISNAIKFKHPKRIPQIRIESFKSGGFICIQIQDNGLGLDIEKYGHRIFGIYNNFHNGSLQGKGIGLKLVKTQIEALGGKIELESSLGMGSTFKVYLPQTTENITCAEVPNL